VLGAPPLLLAQSLTGGSRPNEVTHGSDWSPFQDDNGVSGHAFLGAIPYPSAARMAKRPWVKATLFAVSTIPGFSRITDDAHYPSQVFLGWTLAFVATSTVDETTRARQQQVELVPWTAGDGVGVGFETTR